MGPDNRSLARKRDEFCYFLADRCIYTHESGEEMALDELSAFVREIQDVTWVRAAVVVLISLLLAQNRQPGDLPPVAAPGRALEHGSG
jgi:hypothetical protein